MHFKGHYILSAVLGKSPLNTIQVLKHTAVTNTRHDANLTKIGQEARKPIQFKVFTTEHGCRHFEYLIRYLFFQTQTKYVVWQEYAAYVKGNILVSW